MFYAQSARVPIQSQQVAENDSRSHVDREWLQFLPPDPPHCVRGERSSSCRLTPPSTKLRGAGGENLQRERCLAPQRRLFQQPAKAPAWTKRLGFFSRS